MSAGRASRPRRCRGGAAMSESSHRHAARRRDRPGDHGPRPGGAGEAGGVLRVRGARVRRSLDRRARHRAHRRDARRVPQCRRGAAGGCGGTEVGQHRSERAAPRAGAARAAQGVGAVREPAPGQAAARAVRRLAAEARADRGDRPARRARADGRDLLRREDTHGRGGQRRVRVHDRGDRADRPRRVQSRTGEGLERGQGQRVGDIAAVAGGRDRVCTRASFRTSSSSTCSWTTPRCSWWRRRDISTRS